MIHSEWQGRARLQAVGAICIVLVSGCAASQSGPRPSDGSVAAAKPNSDALNKVAGISQTVQVVAGVLPLGTVPYDNMTLPLASPDGRYLATQTGAPPTWQAVLAERGAGVSSATRIEIYALDVREGIEAKDRQPPALVIGVDESALLGRSCDQGGFLIESPRDDGSRWIGKVGWQSGAVTWLVKDQSVNAFATMGPEGRLAWSRRGIEGEYFDLVVRNGSSEWVAPAAAEQWLMPTWSGQGDGLFVLSLGSGDLNANFALASDLDMFRQSRQRLPLATECNVHIAFQALTGQGGAIDLETATRDQLVFFHPAGKRMALWRPLAEPGRKFAFLYSRSVAGLVDEEEFALTATNNGLLRQSLSKPNEFIQLVAGTQIPRATKSQDWPFLLLQPGENSVGVMAMRLLPREEAVFQSRRTSR